MGKKELIGNREGVDPPVYDHYPTGVRRAVLVHVLGDGDCPKCWEEKENHYTDGNKVYKKVPLEL